MNKYLLVCDKKVGNWNDSRIGKKKNTHIEHLLKMVFGKENLSIYSDFAGLVFRNGKNFFFTIVLQRPYLFLNEIFIMLAKGIKKYS